MAGNTFYLLSSYGLISGIGLLVTILITRYLGPERYGDLTLTYAYLGLFTLLIHTQLGLTLIRETSQVDQCQMSHYLGNGVLLQVILSVVGTAVAILILPLLGYAPETASLLRLASLLLLLAPFSSFRLIFLVTQEIRLVAMLDTIIQVFSLVLSLLVILLRGGVATILVLRMVSTGLGGLLYYYHGRRLLTYPLSYRPDMRVWGLLLRRSGPLIFLGLMNAIQIHGARLLIGRYLSRREGGLYGVTMTLMAALTLLPVIYYTSVYPLLARTYHEDRVLFNQICRFSFKGMILVATTLSLLAILAGQQIIVLYAGIEFAEAAPLFTALAAMLVFRYSGATVYHIILAMGAQNLLPFAASARVILYLVVLLLLLSPLGLLAAPLANLAIFLFVFTLYGLLRRTRSYVLMWLHELWRPLFISMLLVLFLKQFTFISPLMGPLLALPLYVVLLFLSGVLSRQEMGWLLWKPRRSHYPLLTLVSDQAAAAHGQEPDPGKKEFLDESHFHIS